MAGLSHTVEVAGRGNILVVDDEPRIREVVQYALEQEGFTVFTAGDGASAEKSLRSDEFLLVVLDIMLPDTDGFELCRRLRQEKMNTPVLFLSARSEELDRVLGLELGADDYLTKPFGTRELVARVKAVLRRTQPDPSLEPTSAAEATVTVGPMKLDTERHEFRVAGQIVPLTPTEFAVLAALMRRPGIVFSRGQLSQLSGSAETHITERTMDTHIRRIRAKLREHQLNPVKTVHGLGYKLQEFE